MRVPEIHGLWVVVRKERQTNTVELIVWMAHSIHNNSWASLPVAFYYAIVLREVQKRQRHSTVVSQQEVNLTCARTGAIHTGWARYFDWFTLNVLFGNASLRLCCQYYHDAWVVTVIWSKLFAELVGSGGCQDSFASHVCFWQSCCTVVHSVVSGGNKGSLGPYEWVQPSLRSSVPVKMVRSHIALNVLNAGIVTAHGKIRISERLD